MTPERFWSIREGMPIRVAIVENDPKYLNGVNRLLQSLPSMEVVGKFTRGEEAIQGIGEKRPDVAFIDLGLPDKPGEEVIRAVSAKGCRTELLVLTRYDDDEHLFAALRAGATGYIVKSQVSPSELARAVEEAMRGGAPMSMGIARRVLKEFGKIPPKGERPEFRELTRREVEVLELLAQGYSRRKIATFLGISEETVHSLLKSIYEKLHVNKALEAAAVYWMGRTKEDKTSEQAS